MIGLRGISCSSFVTRANALSNSPRRRCAIANKMRACALRGRGGDHRFQVRDRLFGFAGGKAAGARGNPLADIVGLDLYRHVEVLRRLRKLVGLHVHFTGESEQIRILRRLLQRRLERVDRQQDLSALAVGRSEQLAHVQAVRVEIEQPFQVPLGQRIFA